MQIQDMVPALTHAIQVISYGIAGIVVAATAIAKVTPSTKDDELVEKMGDGFYKLLSFLPTFGINPNTQKLQDAYLAQRAELEALKTPKAS